MREKILAKFEEINWEYGPHDPAALALLRERIEATGRRFGLISYSDLVKGVDFHYPNISHGDAYRINTYDWSGLDRRIVGDCLGYLSVESYVAANFMASALVIGRLDSRPADNFFEWMEYLEVLPDTREDTVLAFWTKQVHLAHQWYAYGNSAAT